ncbi:hypothetical protein [Streptomyces auratus]|uniref:Uncharacterized protein n=1 Tax=Streptomyces auratus AGR0001 TaxID=1160718 RepID=J1RQ08_9ACTN|nr:hypothetical protein [Streptomyces auratus]QTZ93188.1 hypothetical protein SU9_018315 [Streptomyces auratus AGR0001]
MAEWSGFYPCTCIAVDAQAYGGNNDRRQSEIQHDLPRILSRAARGTGLDRSQWHIQPKGDEELAVHPMDGTEPRLVDDFVRHLVAELREYNGMRVPTARMRLRAAIHHGPVELADNGFAGSTVVTTARLLSSRHLYDALRTNDGADLALLLSDDVYRSTVAGGHTTLSAADFRCVTVREKECEAVAWLQVPGHVAHHPVAGGPLADRPQPPTDGGPDDGPSARHDYRSEQISVNHFTAPVDLRGGVVGFGSASG